MRRPLNGCRGKVGSRTRGSEEGGKGRIRDENGARPQQERVAEDTSGPRNRLRRAGVVHDGTVLHDVHDGGRIHHGSVLKKVLDRSRWAGRRRRRIRRGGIRLVCGSVPMVATGDTRTGHQAPQHRKQGLPKHGQRMPQEGSGGCHSVAFLVGPEIKITKISTSSNTTTICSTSKLILIQCPQHTFL